MRVLLLTQWFDPEPTPKGLSFARELVRQGFEVEVVTGFPNYPGGNLYPGYRMRLIQRELIDGVQVTRLPLYMSHDSSALRRVANYASFAASVLFYGLFFAKRADVIYAYHPPLTVGMAARLIRMFRRTTVVYDIQDMWPDTLRATGMLNSEKALGFVAKVCDWVYRGMDRIVVLSPGFRRLLIERGVPESRIEVIYNWCDEAQLADVASGLPSAFPSPGSFRVLFAGTMGKAQALDAVMDAAKLLQARRPEVRFVFVGGGVEVEHLKKVVLEQQLANVVFIPRVPMSEVGAMLQAADALLVHLKDDPLFTITIPSKTQAYMATGKPVLMAVRGDAADLVQASACGVCIEPENAASIVSAVERILDAGEAERQAMGQRGKDYYQRELSLSVGVARFAKLFRRLVSAA